MGPMIMQAANMVNLSLRVDMPATISIYEVRTISILKYALLTTLLELL